MKRPTPFVQISLLSSYQCYTESLVLICLAVSGEKSENVNGRTTMDNDSMWIEGTYTFKILPCQPSAEFS